MGIGKTLGTAAVAVVALAVIVVMFGAILTTFSKDLRVNTPATDVQIVVPLNSTVLVGTTGQYPFLKSITGCYNSTNQSQEFNKTPDNYTTLEGNTAGGFMNTIDELLDNNTNTVSWNGETVNCTISYLAASSATTAANAFNTGLGVFATFAAVIVLAIVGMVIIRLFKKGEGDV